MRDAVEDLTRISAAVGVARVICILGVVYVHAWTGRGGAGLAAAATSFQGVLRWVLMELLGRSAVPLLGMISGWLAVGSVRRRSYASFLAGRARTVLAPMVLWNLAAVVLVSGAGLLGLIDAPRPPSGLSQGGLSQGALWLVNEIFCLTAPNQINVQTPFLRDLFVCIAMAPLLVRLPRWALLAVAATAAAWAVSGVAFPLLLRPQILLFFVLGVVARQDGLARRLAALPLATFAAPYAALASVAAWVGIFGDAHGLAPGWTTASLDLLLRFAAGTVFWSVAWRLAARPAGRILLRAEPYIFLTFCTHMILIWFAGPWIGRVTGPLGSPLYPLFLLTQPLLVLAAAVAIGRLLQRISPAAARLLSGGRLQAGRDVGEGEGRAAEREAA